MSKPKLSKPTKAAPSRWRYVFPAYAVPALVDRLVVEGYAQDLSDRNDSAPAFGFDMDDGTDTWSILLWVEHPDEGEREDGVDSPRYFVTYMLNGEMVEQREAHRAIDAVKAYLEVAEAHELIEDTDDFDPDV